MTLRSNFRVLVVDDDRAFCAIVSEVLSDRYEVVSCHSGHEALEVLSRSTFDLIISDVNMPGMSGPELLTEVQRKYPATKTILITSYNIDDYIEIARDHSFSTIMSKTMPFNSEELETTVEGILTGQVFGLKRYLGSEAQILGSFEIRSSQEAREIRQHVVELFLDSMGTAGDMKLLIDEAVTNAIYHAPHLPDGTAKYEELTEVQLDEGEYVVLVCGVGKNRYGISVSDSQGMLNKKTVLDKIARQVNGEGLLDDSGRGIHMSRLFSDMMVINIKPKSRTEVVLINYISDKPRGFKPLYINEL